MEHIFEVIITCCALGAGYYFHKVQKIVTAGGLEVDLFFDWRKTLRFYSFIIKKTDDGPRKRKLRRISSLFNTLGLCAILLMILRMILF
jgi:hypothetical protein